MNLPGSWAFGHAIGFSLSSPAQDSKDNTADASGAPVLLASLGELLEFPIGNEKDGHTFGFEGGAVKGWSASESFSDIDDGAWYVGFSLKVNWGTVQDAVEKAYAK